MSERQLPPSDLAAGNGWAGDFEFFSKLDLPTYVGQTTFANLPWIDDPVKLGDAAADVAIVGAPFDDMVTHRPGTR